MNYPVVTSIQLRGVLRALRQSRGLSQAQVGQLLGVNQKRIAAIESAPGVTSFDQISRLVAALGGRVVIEVGTEPAAATQLKKNATKRKSASQARIQNQANW